MKDKLLSYNRLASTFVILTETLLSGLLFLLLGRLMDGMHWRGMQTDGATDLQIMLTLMLCYSLCAVHSGVVLHRRKIHSFQILMRVFQNLFLFTLLGGLVLTLGHYADVCSLFMLAYLCLLSLCLLSFRFGLRFLIRLYRRWKGNLRLVVLVGSTGNNLEIYHEIAGSEETGYVVVGYFEESPNPAFPDECPYLGRPDEVTDYLAGHEDIHYLFCCLPSRDSDIIVPLIDYCENHVVHFFSVPNVRNYLHHRMSFNIVGNVPYLGLRPDPLSWPGNRLLKRIFDIVVSSVFLCTLFPVILIVVAIITGFTMPGPLFFRQKRNGLNGKEFYCYKFRSMKVNKDADRLQATENDPRKTRWGNIMRKTNIDELPQFINVLLGDMSLVGPRPHMLLHTQEYSRLINKYMVRHFVKPGITGWSQVTGFRGETKELKDMEGRIRGDIWYLEHWSFMLDLYIIYKTVANIFKGEKNAY
ncbi:undecaprenyl-phosphate glucose phosphotransferase [Phocaeicola sp.]